MAARGRARRRRGHVLCATIAAAGVLTTVRGWPGPGELEAHGDLGWTNAAAGMLMTALGLLLLAGTLRRRLQPTGDRVVLVLFLVPPAVLGLLVLGDRLPPLVDPVLGLFLLWPAVFAVLLFAPPGPAGGPVRA